MRKNIDIILGSIFMSMLYFFVNICICRNTFLDVLLLILPSICIVMFPMLYLNYKKNIGG